MHYSWRDSMTCEAFDSFNEIKHLATDVTLINTWQNRKSAIFSMTLMGDIFSGSASIEFAASKKGWDWEQAFIHQLN